MAPLLFEWNILSGSLASLRRQQIKGGASGSAAPFKEADE
jgi:hypothetical protein